MSDETRHFGTIQVNSAVGVVRWPRVPMAEALAEFEHVVDVAHWRRSRQSGVALVPAYPDDQAFRLSEARRAIADRVRMAPWLCDTIAAAMINAVDEFEERRHDRLRTDRIVRRFSSIDTFPGYCRLRDYLAFELGADYVTACRSAFYHTERHEYISWGLYRGIFSHRMPLGMRGWL